MKFNFLNKNDTILDLCLRKKQISFFWRACNQCDQMAVLFIQYLAIYSMKLAQKHKILTKVGLICCQKLNKLAKSRQILLKFCQSGEILPNLATLHVTTTTIYVSIGPNQSIFCHC